MTYNPLDRQLEAVSGARERLQAERASLQKDLAWHKKFNRSTAVASLKPLEAAVRRIMEDCTPVTAKLAAQKLLTNELESKARAGWNLFYWLSSEHTRANGRLKEHRELVAGLEKEDKRLSRQLATAKKQFTEAKRTIAKFDKFDSDSVQEGLANLDAEFSLREIEREELAVRKAVLDRHLEAPVEEMQRLRAEMNTLRSRREFLEEDRSRLDQRLREVERLDERLTGAPNSYERRLLHEECERRFGSSRPRDVMRETRGLIQHSGRESQQVTTHLASLDRNTKKLEARIKKIADRGSRVVRSLIIDGSNLCYQQQSFIGLTVLKPLCRTLVKTMNVTVIFDASVRRALEGDDVDLAKDLPGATVHVVASRTSADETILDAAKDEYIFVLSNDRFAEYPDKAAVRNDRLIRHEILNGHAMVHDLAIDLPFLVHE